MKNFFEPPPHKEQLPKGKIDGTYKRLRWQVFLGAFIGYAAYYLVRKNLALAAPDMIASPDAGGLGYTKAQIGIAMSALSIAYAFSKFIMGSLSDRSDTRKFMVTGLLLAAGVMLMVGLLPFATSSLAWLFIFMFIAGWISGMGWPPCGRIMAHWFSHSERSFKMSIWNTSHTLGSGLLGNFAVIGVALIGGWFCIALPGGESLCQSWRAIFVFPALVAVVLALFCWWALRDTPQSCGLPPVAEWRNDPSPVKEKAGEEKKIPVSRLFVDYIFKNRVLWMIALANAFVYFVRYGIGDWSVTYLREMSILDAEGSKLAFALHNYAGIPGTIICGLLSAKLFKGRCAPANVIYMLMVVGTILIYWQATPVASWLATILGTTMEATRVGLVYFALIAVGFCIYGPVALVSVQAINLVPKNAAGTAAGFVGLFGYLIGDALLSKIVIGYVASSSWGWNATFWLLIISGIVAALLCASTWRSEKLISETK